MSIFLLAAAPTINFPPGSLAMAVLASLGVAAVAGVFNSRTILGPRRLSAEESPRVLLRVIGFAVMAWAVTWFVLGAYEQSASRAAGQATTQPSPAKLTDGQLVGFSLAVDGVLLAVMLVATRWLRPDGFKRVGIAWRRLPAGAVAGLFWIVVAFPLVMYIDAVTEFVFERRHWSHPPHELLRVFKDSPHSWLPMGVVVAAGVVAPLAEEMFFRGQVQTLLRYALKRPWPAVIVAAALFALMHPLSTWPAIFFLGICLGYVYERTGNLWASIAMHSIFNLLSISAFYWSLGHPG